jgi:low temperature requirement protein LtrA
VFAVTEVATLLHADHSGAGAVRALIVFVPVYWTWVGTAVQTNLRDMTSPPLRLAVFAVALTGLFMAIALPEAYGPRAVLFACSYWAARLVLGVLLLTASRWALDPVTVSMVITGPLLVAGALGLSSARPWIWGAAALIDLSTPTALQRRLRGMHFDAPHLAERFGLFVLIGSGESVVAIGASAEATGSITVAVGAAVAAAFVASCGLWWVYFNFAADAVRHALATAAVQLDIIAVGVGMREAVAAPGEVLRGPSPCRSAAPGCTWPPSVTRGG